MDFWFQTYALPHIREATKIGYSGNIQRHIKPQLGHIKLNKLTENDLQQFYTHLKKEGRLTKTELYGPGLSNQMVRSCHLICRQALEKATGRKVRRCGLYSLRLGQLITGQME